MTSLRRARRPLLALVAVLVLALPVAAPVASAGAHAVAPVTDANGVPVGNPVPAVAPMAPRRHAILALGDSDLAQGVYTLSELLAQQGIDAPVYDAHGNGWGLLDPLDGASALDVLDRVVAEHPDVDTVVLGFVGVCAVACGPGKLAYGSAPFYDAWDAAARALVTRARLYGLQVVWAVSPPPAPSPTAEPPVEDWLSLPMRHQVATTLVDHSRNYAHAFGIAGADMSQALSDTSGGWQRQISYDGAEHDVRLDDGVHLTDDGSRRASRWTMATLAQLWSHPQVESVV
jgi:hypothetical protein